MPNFLFGSVRLLSKNLKSEKKVKNLSDEVYGSQISEFAVEGILKEADINFNYDYIIGALDNGIVYELRKPTVFLSNFNYPHS